MRLALPDRRSGKRSVEARRRSTSTALDRPGEIQGIGSTWLAQRLYHEFRQGDGLALVSLEGILLEMLAEGARHAGRRTASP